MGFNFYLIFPPVSSNIAYAFPHRRPFFRKLNADSFSGILEENAPEQSLLDYMCLYVKYYKRKIIEADTSPHIMYSANNVYSRIASCKLLNT